MADLKSMKGLSAEDRKMIAEAEALLGPEPSSMGFIKNMFWGRFREDAVLPYPEVDAEEAARCDQLLAALDDYLKNEHPAIQIDQEQEIPDWAIKKLFDLGVMGMTVGREYGGGGFGITSYNRVLERIGRVCGSTAVLVSAHQSIGCKAVMLYGTPEQKDRWLKHLAKDWLSAFCLSEPNVGCDAGGQETTIETSEDGQYYIVNGEKKWATSAPLSGIFTVMGKHKVVDPKTGKEKVKVSAVVCSPDMEGVEVFENNRSKMCIRGTWQGRLRFTNVKVPKKNLLHKEGRGLNVALTCLNFGRCTLSAGMLGGAKEAMDQAIKWARTRYQFARPLADFELVKLRIARMSALCYAMDAMLYMTTGMIDRGDEDIMVETAVVKVFCSEMGYKVTDDALQVMGGEAFMTENEVERIFRDNRIQRVVEGANEVMQSFVFAYGGKQLAEQMIGVQEAMSKNPLNFKMYKLAVPLAMELFLGLRKSPPRVGKVHPDLRGPADRLCKLIRQMSHEYKQASKRYAEKIVTRQAVQARLADVAIWLHAWTCTMSKLDMQLRRGDDGVEFERDKAAAMHLFDMAEVEIDRLFRELYDNADDSMLAASEAAIKHNDTLPVGDYYIHERSPVAQDQGRKLHRDVIKQFPGGFLVNVEEGEG
jgi:alkylation response protein AidB-like acyl-CoA dehydrogenase